MLLGEFRHSLDAKGRVFLPARWREELSEGVVVTRGLERCLLVMTKERFMDRAARLGELPSTRRANREFARLFFGAASEEQVDKQGRMTIPQILREHAGLSKDVVMVGVSDQAEIWDRSAWESYRQPALERYEETAEQLDL